MKWERQQITISTTQGMLPVMAEVCGGLAIHSPAIAFGYRSDGEPLPKTRDWVITHVGSGMALSIAGKRIAPVGKERTKRRVEKLLPILDWTLPASKIKKLSDSLRPAVEAALEIKG